ncbi:MAG TPA: hypothetical protein PKJ42_10630 [Candidatus Goldiibacteriota bacterium]|nr:hypothetical protein [Candidatus Goldiibacteriota bacterium]
MNKKLFLASVLMLVFYAAANGADAAVSPATDDSEKKIFIQVGALEKQEGDKYILRKKSGEIEFYLDDNALFYSREKAKPEDMKEGMLVLIKGAKNQNAVLASTVQIYNGWDSYESTKDIGAESGSGMMSGTIKGTVVRARSESNEYESLQEKYLTTQAQNDEALIQEAGVEGAGTAITDKEGYIRPFYIKTADKKIYMVMCDDSTPFTLTDKKTKADMKVGDRLKLYFNKRITIRYKSYPIKVVIGKAK